MECEAAAEQVRTQVVFVFGFFSPLIATILSVQIRCDNEKVTGISPSLNATAAAALFEIIMIKSGLPGLYTEWGSPSLL